MCSASGWHINDPEGKLITAEGCLFVAVISIGCQMTSGVPGVKGEEEEHQDT